MSIDDNLFSEVDYELYTVPTGYVARKSISVFDHWLTEDEAEKSRVMFYQLSKDQGAVSEYLEGENNFLHLYNKFASQGVICNLWEKGVRELMPGKLLNKLFIKSLREERFMDIYFKYPKVRILGGYDRTDTLLYSSETDTQLIKSLIEDMGLFLLERNLNC